MHTRMWYRSINAIYDNIVNNSFFASCNNSYREFIPQHITIYTIHGLVCLSRALDHHRQPQRASIAQKELHVQLMMQRHSQFSLLSIFVESSYQS